jgi:hypothetical protein
MKNQRLKQFTVSLLVVLSLFVSSVSACTCAHHQEKVEADVSSCHQHSPKAEAEQQFGTNPFEKIQSVISETECCCIQPAPKVVAKSESIKIDKQILASNSENTNASECVLECVRSTSNFHSSQLRVQILSTISRPAALRLVYKLEIQVTKN